MNDIKQIVNLIFRGKLSRDNDEKYAGGFWDLAGTVANGFGPDTNITDADAEYLQEAIYDGLWQVYEASTEGKK